METQQQPPVSPATARASDDPAPRESSAAPRLTASRSLSSLIAPWERGEAFRGRWTEVWLSCLIALFVTFVFYVQALVPTSLNAGFVYTGDFFHVWLPQAAKVTELVRHGALSGIDFSTHGGASEFFLRPNLYPYHPLGIVYGALSNSDAPGRLIRFAVLLLALHSFLGCWFGIRLGLRYFHFNWAVSVFFAMGYCFSVQMVCAAGFPPFLLCASLVPWAIYAGLAVAERPSWRSAALYSVPIFVMFTGGYVPIAITAVAVSWLIVAARVLLAGPELPWISRGQSLLLASSPFAIATVVAGPLYFAMAIYHNLVHAVGAVSIFFSAHQLAEQPRTLLRLISSRMFYAGPTFEFTVIWGLVPLAVILLFVAGMRVTDQLSRSDSRLLLFSLSLYGFLVLAIYGDYSSASDLLFFVPFIGRMHIYQRHLLVGHMLFMLALAVMLKTVMDRGRQPYLKTMLFLSAGLLVVCTHLLAIDSDWAKHLHLNDFLIVELLFATVFVVFAFLAPGPVAAVAAAFLALLVPLDQFYNFSTSAGNRYDAQRPEQLSLDEGNRQRVTSYLKQFGGSKEIIKYVDVTPGIAKYFSRNHPWFIALDLPVSSYGGYDFLLAQRKTYFQKMNFTVTPDAVGTGSAVPAEIVSGKDWIMWADWNWVKQTGGQFVLYQEGYQHNDPRLAEVADLSDPAKVLRLPKNLVLAPLKIESPSFGAPGLRGRHVRVQLNGKNYLSLAEVRVLDAKGTNLAQGRPALQSSSIGAASGQPGKAVDGITDGDFAKGSVTHTGADDGAWWEVDLGESREIGSVQVFNRTDGAGERLSDFWLFVSDSPFTPADTPATLSARAGTAKVRVTGRPSPSVAVAASAPVPGPADTVLFDNGYFRLLGEAGGATAAKFWTNRASEFQLEVNAAKPARLQYLFWPNERLTYFLNGRSIRTTIEDGLVTVPVPAGRHRFEMQYTYWPLKIFLFFYALYALGLGALLIYPAVPPPWRARIASLWTRNRRPIGQKAAAA